VMLRLAGPRRRSMRSANTYIHPQAHPEASKACKALLYTYLNNLVSDPDNPKFRHGSLLYHPPCAATASPSVVHESLASISPLSAFTCHLF